MIQVARREQVAPCSAAELATEAYGYDSEEEKLWKQVTVGPCVGPRLFLQASPGGLALDQLRAAWDQTWLRGGIPGAPVGRAPRRELKVVDLFAGCGAMSLGLKMAAEAIGLNFKPLIAADFEPGALRVYEANHRPSVSFGQDVSTTIEFNLGRDAKIVSPPSLLNEEFNSAVGQVDVLIGGPPCQGHSNLNNHSRRNDPKNSLYYLMAAMAVALRPKVVIIENVPSVVHDKTRVVQRSRETLDDNGYSTSEVVLSMADLGVAQRRKRHVLVAILGKLPFDLTAAVAGFRSDPRPLSWCISDLSDRTGAGAFDSSSAQSDENRSRIDWLFENGEFDLPDKLRPKCHRDSGHSYRSMYGRMHWDEPAQTVTSGFGSPGQGRYIHPRRKRTLTPHEAARIQFLPDSFNFDGLGLSKKQLSVMIGNAVPPKMSYVVGLAALAALGERGPVLQGGARRTGRT